MINLTFSPQHQPGTRTRIGDAIQYSPESGGNIISLAHEADMANVKIQDTGYGIPRADRPHVFDQFYRICDNGPAEIKGNRLGLAIVKPIAEQHNSNVTVEGEPGIGSCFMLKIPLIQAENHSSRDIEIHS